MDAVTLVIAAARVLDVSVVTGLLLDAWTELQVRGHRGHRLTPLTAQEQQTSCPKPPNEAPLIPSHLSSCLSLHATGATMNAASAAEFVNACVPSVRRERSKALLQLLSQDIIYKNNKT